MLSNQTYECVFTINWLQYRPIIRMVKVPFTNKFHNYPFKQVGVSLQQMIFNLHSNDSKAVQWNE
jgi:hypothetical protein